MSTYPADPGEAVDAADPAEEAVWCALDTVEDPELPISVVDLGLIYDVAVTNGTATVEMTLTYSGCPAREILLEDVQTAVEECHGIDSVDVSLVYSPPWNIDRITTAGREALAEWGMAVPEEAPQSQTCAE